MTKDKYLEMCKTFGDVPDEEKMPPDLDDFPDYMIMGLDIFNCLPDTYSGGMEPIYTGKDLSALPTLYDIFGIEKEEKMRIFKVIQFLDTRARKKAISDAKKKNRK